MPREREKKEIRKGRRKREKTCSLKHVHQERSHRKREKDQQFGRVEAPAGSHRKQQGGGRPAKTRGPEIIYKDIYINK